MKTTIERRKRCRAEEARAEFAKLLSAAQSRGFHGTASITVSLQDGHIQHLRIATERIVR